MNLVFSPSSCERVLFGQSRRRASGQNQAAKHQLPAIQPLLMRDG